ncbi:MAG: hypothetical protein R2991_04890 [Thermoanaerobaculia bacterium]
MTVIPYGVDTETSPDPARRAVWRERLGLPADAVLALSVGRMVTKKGFQVLLPELPALFERHPPPRRPRRRGRRWRSSGSPPGPGSPSGCAFQDRPARRCAADLYRPPTSSSCPRCDARNVDGLPGVILEAMASGLTVVASESRVSRWRSRTGSTAASFPGTARP